MALSSKHGKPLAQVKFEAFDEAARALNNILIYENVKLGGVTAQDFAKVLQSKCDKLKAEYRDIFVN